jgi:hypothetical protein
MQHIMTKMGSRYNTINIRSGRRHTHQSNDIHPHQHPTTTRHRLAKLPQGRIAKNIWAAIETNPNSTTSITAIKALWKLASVLW